VQTDRGLKVTDYRTQLSLNLRGARARSGALQLDLAKAIKCGQTHYSKIERGAAELRLSQAAMMAHELGCTIDEFLRDITVDQIREHLEGINENKNPNSGFRKKASESPKKPANSRKSSGRAKARAPRKGTPANLAAR
jgi:transcriptional regulator with XRE-family HTH domain